MMAAMLSVLTYFRGTKTDFYAHTSFNQSFGIMIIPSTIWKGSPVDVRIHLRSAYQWASYQIRKIAGCACAGNTGNVFPHRRLQRKTLVSDPVMHHGTCVTHVTSWMSGSLTRCGGENVPDIPGACVPAVLRIWQEAHGIHKCHQQVLSMCRRTLGKVIFKISRIDKDKPGICDNPGVLKLPQCKLMQEQPLTIKSVSLYCFNCALHKRYWLLYFVSKYRDSECPVIQERIQLYDRWCCVWYIKIHLGISSAMSNQVGPSMKMYSNLKQPHIRSHPCACVVQFYARAHPFNHVYVQDRYVISLFHRAVSFHKVLCKRDHIRCSVL